VENVGDDAAIAPTHASNGAPRPNDDRADEYHRCIQAANGDEDAWADFCNSVGPEQNNVVGGQSAKLACRQKILASSIAKVNWCENQYGNHDGDESPSIVPE
jgi:hypothetical protein